MDTSMIPNAPSSSTARRGSNMSTVCNSGSSNGCSLNINNTNNIGSIGSNSNSHSPRNATVARLGRSTGWVGVVVAFALGHWHGRALSGTANQFSMEGLEWTQTTPYEQRVLASATASSADENDGWRIIHVFIGDTSPSSITSSERVSIGAAVKEQRSLREDGTNTQPIVQWHSQARQDELIFRLLRNKTEGFFIDLAANDATLLSNTYTLEQSYQWRGVCIEPNPIYWYNLTALRSCTVVAAVVGDQRGQEVFFRFEAGDHGGIADHGYNNGRRWQDSSERRSTVSLLEILRDRAMAPVLIDYLSLDVEGAETLIMLNFPLDQYRIKVITAERLHGDIRKYLKSKGYEFVARLSTWGESLWVHESVRDELDWSVMEQFHFPL